MDSFSILTYNVQFNRALKTIGDIVHTHAPDIICLQEVNIGKKHLYEPLFPGYSLAATSNSFWKYGRTYGLATFYKSNAFFQIGSKSIFLPRTYYEICIAILTWRGARTALRTDFVTRDSLRPLSIYNLHLTALIATNAARNKQLRETLEDLELRVEQSTVVLGDFNYPFRKRGLEKIIHSYQLEEATADLTYTQAYFGPFWKDKLKFDYVLYKYLDHQETCRLDKFRSSDHYPVLSTFSF